MVPLKMYNDINVNLQQKLSFKNVFLITTEKL